MTEPYYEQDGLALYQGDVLDTLAQLPPDSVDCVVTSPPYWSLRNYSGEQARKRMDYGIKGVMAMQNGQHELGKEA